MANKSIFRANRVANKSVSGWLDDHAVVVEDGLITAIEPAAKLSSAGDSYEVFDLGDVSLLPGLVDAHCHMHCSATHDAQALALTENVQQLTTSPTWSPSSWRGEDGFHASSPV